MGAYEDLITKIQKLDDKIKTVNTQVETNKDILDICIRKSDLEVEMIRVRTDVNNISSSVTDLHEKLTKIYLPDDTKYYMDETELKNLRNKIRQLNAILVRLETLEKNIVKTLNITLLDND